MRHSIIGPEQVTDIDVYYESSVGTKIFAVLASLMWAISSSLHSYKSTKDNFNILGVSIAPAFGVLGTLLVWLIT